MQLFNHLTEGEELLSNNSEETFPIIIRKLTNKNSNDNIQFILNYSSEPKEVSLKHSGTSLLTGDKFNVNDNLKISPWGVEILSDIQ